MPGVGGGRPRGRLGTAPSWRSSEDRPGGRGVRPQAGEGADVEAAEYTSGAFWADRACCTPHCTECIPPNRHRPTRQTHKPESTGTSGPDGGLGQISVIWGTEGREFKIPQSDNNRPDHLTC